MWLFSRSKSEVQPTAEADEAQPLLRQYSDASTHKPGIRRSSTPLTVPYNIETHSSSGEDSDSASEDSEDDEEALKSYRKERLKQNGGGIIAYLKPYKIFWPYIWPSHDRRFQLYFLVLCISTLCQRALNVLGPRQLGIVIEALYSTFGTGSIPWNPIAIWLVLEALNSESGGLPSINTMLEERIARWSHFHLSLASFEHVMGLSMSFHDNKDSGEVIRAIEQSEALNSLLRTLFLDTTPVILDLVIAAWYVTYLLDAYAILIVMFVGLSFSAVTYLISLLMTKSRRISASKVRVESKVVYESVSNWPTISYFNRSRHEQERLARVIKSSLKASQWNDDVHTMLFAAQEYCEIVGRVMISILAAYRVAMGWTPVGNFVALESYWTTITMPLWIMGHSYRQLSNDLVDAERLLQLFETTSDIQDDPDATTLLAREGGKIEFNSVGFSYNVQTSRNTLSDISFSVFPGETVALVGETGSGKSTTLKLLMRFYDVTSGCIKIDGQEIRQVTLSSLRDCFGFVPQQAALFNMSIRENVRYGRLDASDEEVHRACRAACIHDKILTFPNGYDTKVGERGVKLSGGELQRVAIARVILRDPKIVLLDEATSSLDSETEAKVQAALAHLTAGKTTVVIAHRLSTVTKADCILVVDEGRVVERGSHLELVGRGGRYADLWRKQTLVSAKDRGETEEEEEEDDDEVDEGEEDRH